jgi:small subunit ribosomal protein S8
MKFTNHHISDLVVRIRNASQRGHSFVSLPNVKIVYSVLILLKDQGYVGEIKKENNILLVELRYIKTDPVIKQILVVSKPSKRVYSSVNDISLFYNGLGITVLSTPKGILTDIQARESGVGGEILCQVF